MGSFVEQIADLKTTTKVQQVICWFTPQMDKYPASPPILLWLAA